MFPVSRLFVEITCPDFTTCSLNPCLFSHQPPARAIGVRTSAVLQVQAPANGSVPQKRAAGIIEDSGSNKTARIEAAPREGGGTPSNRSASSVVASSSASSALSRSQPQASTSKLIDVGQPRIQMKGATHTPFPMRQKMITLLFNQFIILYASLASQAQAKNLASLHAVAQELNVYTKSNKASYKNTLISSITRLKKRTPPTIEEECGTLEEEAIRLKAAEEFEKGRLTTERVRKFVSKKEILEKYDYMIKVPPGRGGEEPTEEGNVRKCDRCGTEWGVRGKLTPADLKACSYHFGKMVTEKLGGIKSRVFSCCPALGAVPCSIGPHIFTDKDIAKLHSRIPFILTGDLESVKHASKSHPKLDIIALDCELVYTTSGMSLARLTAIDATGSIILDEKLRPQGTLLDRNVRFSGVKVEDIEGAKLNLRDVREALGKLINEETILVGHGLENDLKALRLVHLNVIDTAIIFPHPRGMPWRHALRNLSRDVLGKFIQDGDPSLGHSAVDDSQAALELLRWKVKQGK